MTDKVLNFLIRFFLLLCLLIIVLPPAASGRVVLNEILANEPGSRVKLEWVELFNPDTSAIDLGGWTFISKSDTTIFPAGTLIPEKNYLILARKLVSVPPDPESFEYHWGNGSGIWGDYPEESYPAIEVKLSLNNSSGTVTFIDPQQNSSSFSWNKDAGDGVSWERISPSGEDSISNWGFCIFSKGSTPGKVNSVTPADNDLSISPQNLSIEPQSPEENDFFRLKVKVTNTGISISKENLLYFFCDYDLDGVLEGNESLGSPEYIPLIPVNQDFIISKELSFSKGVYRLYVQIGEDEKEYNNQAFINIRVGQTLPEIVINEFLCSPGDNQPEWIELYNRTATPVNLRSWHLGDSTGQSLITNEDLNLFPREYLILTENRSLFLSSYPEANCNVIEPPSWHILNNGGDWIIFQDSLGFTVDELSYAADADIKGISQERVSPERVSSDQNNWWRSVDPKGSTPCRKNSLFDSYSLDRTKLDINPNPFSPDGDGFEDQTGISFDIPFKSELTLKIYDVRGRQVRTLMDKSPQVSGEIVWDGKDNNGNIVRVGIYILYLKTSGSSNLSKKTTIAVAKR
ncbi:MAG: lamin tail domain-containing protein [candidate division Zixibacteria bacterium]|nr:lamin tail domain-containing protein [candidate division Zixibacteria bacterium]